MGMMKFLALIIASVALASPLAQAQDRNQAFFDRLCTDHGEAAQHARFVDWLVKRLDLNDAQKAAFKDFQDARAKSLSDTKTKLCADKPDLASFESRLVFGQTVLESRLDALKAENPKLIAFYNSLDDRQKKIFDDIRASTHH